MMRKIFSSLRSGWLVIPVVLVLAAAIVLTARYAGQEAGSSSVAGQSGPALMAPAEGGVEIQAKQGPPDASIGRPEAGPKTAPASFDGDLRKLPQTGPAEKKPMIEVKRSKEQVGAVPAVQDPVVQTNQGSLSMPASNNSFKGLDLNNWGAGWPPDTNGDVGPNNYIQTVNTSIGIYNKTGGQLAAFTFDTFFNGTNSPCDSSNQGDPVVVYDAQSGRWIISDFAWTNFVSGPYYQCIAVSKTTDPLSGGWWMYALRADDNSHPWLNDYPKLGVWSDGIYMSANMFDIISRSGMASYNGVRVWALNRDDLISGAPLRSVRVDLGTSYFSLLPSNFRGAQPPSGTPAFFGSISGTTANNFQLWKFHVDWGTPSNSTFTGPTNISVASFNEPSGNVPQKDSSETLDTLGDRLMMQLQYRDINGTQSLWASHTVASGGVTGIRWYEFRNPNGSPTVYQQSTFQPDSYYRWMPSLAVDSQGNMAVGYSVSSSTIDPQIRYAGRLVGDPLNTLGQGETTLIAGTGAQSGGYNRWGDYSAMTVDPVDDCTFWYTTEYYETTGNNWQTRIGSFALPGCGGTTAPTPTFTPTPTATPTFTPTPTGAPTFTPSPTATSTFTPTPTPPSTATTMHVGNLDGSSAAQNQRRWRATVTITVHDANENLLSGVTVSGAWGSGTSGTGSCTTGADGTCSITSSTIANSQTSVSFTVSDLSLSGYTYDPSANHDPDGDSNGTTITIAGP
jgi:hypothetical protein